MKSNFPDKQYLHRLVENLKKRLEDSSEIDDEGRLLVYSGVHLNWVSDYINDPSVLWSLENIDINKLYLTGTNPQWNQVIIGQAKRSPEKLRELMQQSRIASLFSNISVSDDPILVIVEDDNYKVCDGMHRAVAAIYSSKKTIKAYVARIKGKPLPICEAHVIYDLIRAYQRKINPDKEGLVVALRFLCKSYTNVESLLRNRFNNDYIGNKEILDIIHEVLL